MKATITQQIGPQTWVSREVELPEGGGGEGGEPTQPIYLPPVGVWPPPGGVMPPMFPTHPIAPGGGGEGIWGPGSGFPTHPIAPGGSPGYPSHPIAPGGGPSQGPGFPTNPIAPGGPPPGIWPSPGYPSQPIYNPGIWGGAPMPNPTPPIWLLPPGFWTGNLPTEPGVPMPQSRREQE